MSEKNCSICLELLNPHLIPIGLQNNCNHLFCFHCLLTWRRTVNLFSSKSQCKNLFSKNLNGRCPLCRIRSTFIIPSDRYVFNTDEKERLIDEYKSRLKRIRCRNYFRNGFCRYGSRCYYNHSKPISRYRPY